MTVKEVNYDEEYLNASLRIILGDAVVVAMLKAAIGLPTICRMAAEKIFVWEDLFPDSLCENAKHIIRTAMRDLETQGTFQFF